MMKMTHKNYLKQWRQLLIKLKKMRIIKTMTKIQTPSNFNINYKLTNHYVEAYLIAKFQKKVSRKRNEKLKALTTLQRKNLEDQPIFFKKDAAFQYAKFMRQESLILKAQIPASAVIGYVDELRFNSKFISKSHIYGYYPCLKNEEKYVAIPNVLQNATLTLPFTHHKSLTGAH